MEAKPRIVDMDRISMNTKRFLRPHTATILVAVSSPSLNFSEIDKQRKLYANVGDDGHLVTAAHKSSRFLR
jgi:hypothetical protein